MGVQDRDQRYLNAAVEFDIKSLRPTYKLQWGLAGASNALAVAAGLGFDARVVAAARQIAAQAAVSSSDRPLKSCSSCAGFKSILSL